jgi:hypothetical protein
MEVVPCLTNENHVTDVEMTILRRSARIASQQLQQSLQSHQNHASLKLRQPKRARKTKEVRDTIMKCTSKKGKKNIKAYLKSCVPKNIVKDRFADIQKVKISDMFSLVKLHSKSVEERIMKYSFLKTILSNLKVLKIKNLAIDMIKQESNIVKLLSINSLSNSDDRKQSFIEDLFGYPEIIEPIDNVKASQGKSMTMQNDYSNIISQMSSISLNTRVCHIDEIESLLSKLAF